MKHFIVPKKCLNKNSIKVTINLTKQNTSRDVVVYWVKQQKPVKQLIMQLRVRGSNSLSRVRSKKLRIADASLSVCA